jgi:hypothetical protein
MATLEAEQSEITTTHLLKSGAPAHGLTPADRAKGAEIRRQKREAAKEAKLAELLPKAWRMFDKALSSPDVDARALDAAKFVWEQERGKAVQRSELVVAQANPWEGWTPEQVAYVRQQLAARAALEAGGIGGGDP